MAAEIHVKRGNTKSLPVIYKVNGVQTDMNGIKLIFTVKVKLTDTDANALIQKTASISTPNTMSYTFSLTAAETLALNQGAFKCDIKYFKSGKQLSCSVFPFIVEETATHTIV